MAAVIARPRNTRILGRIILLAAVLFVLLAVIAYGPQLWAWGQSLVQKPLPAVQTLEIPGEVSQEELALAAKERGMSVDEYTQFQAFQKSQLAVTEPSTVQTGVAMAAADAVPEVEAAVVTLPGDVMQQLSLLGYSSFEAFASQWGLKVGFDLANGEVDPRELTVCPFETKGCVRMLREKDQYNNIIPFYISNQSGCWHDGWRREVGPARPGGYTVPTRSGVPPQFSGLIEGITIRACRAQDGTSGTLPGTNVPVVGQPQQPPITGGDLVYVGLKIVPSTNLNVRSGPGTEYPEVGQFSLGTSAVVVEQQPGLSWLKVRLDNGIEGWVAGWLTSANLPAPVGSAVPTVTPVPSQTGGGAPPVTGDLGSTYGVTILAGSPNLRDCEGGAKCWSDWQNPVKMKFTMPQGGEYYPSGKSGNVASPIPVGEWWVTGVTLYPGGLK